MTGVKDLAVVITGGLSGIGRATAEAFLAAGARVGILDVGAAEPPVGAVFHAADVRNRDQVRSAVDTLAEDLGGIDVVVNNAGVSAVGAIDENTDEDWARVLDINVTGIARVTAAALPHLRRSGAASVVNLCSVAALNGLPQRALYSASKGAVLSLTYAMATDHVAEGIRVNCVRPGTVSGPFVDAMLQRFPDPVAERRALDNRQATGRMVTPQEVAAAIVFLSSRESASITGTALDIDGGMTHLRVRHDTQETR
ncbi:SDR family NAD(P)-dependent oxidoreductase [Microbacterium rhizosphaerae]|uniref:SDR family oxidoreductase n=1 Tax=Microbacterium rhizosphaerae TaxID=1678237 RepID=A0ABZ0SLG4_9MICO|nr:SDR family oxidoreductase [Microbacterium rhizosphaerae]WPR89121.1 SDR family oxidoreductase [Microbacterium rhizosphaerae]